MSTYPQTPSEARADATGTFVFRLSELMFGSLLAAYVLGFIGLSAALPPHTVAVTPDLKAEIAAALPWLLTIARYIAISTAFAYLTAAFYVSYNFGILTMPTLPLERLRFDFMLALLQAICFGLSLITSCAFPLALSVLLWATAFRQRVEFTQLLDILSHYLRPSFRRDSAKRRAFKTKFLELLKDKPSLSLWSPPGALHVLAAAISSGIGLFALFARFKPNESTQILNQFLPTQLTSLSAYGQVGDLIIASLVVMQGHAVLKKRNVPIYTDGRLNAMDTEFKALMNDLDRDLPKE